VGFLAGEATQGELQVDYGNRTHGHGWKLKKEKYTSLRLHFFSERLVNWWNGLENSTVCATSVNSFKSHLHKNVDQKRIFFLVMDL